jgi:hypothetical protein
MSKFSEWLDAQRGRAAMLAKELMVTPVAVSSVKKGGKRMPPYWMPVVNKISRIPLKTLLEENGSKPAQR